MFEKVLVLFATLPSSNRVKFDSGLGDAAYSNTCELFGTASFTIVIDPGKMTASADSDRSWFPPEPSRSSSRMWYGEPGIAMAALSLPQSARDAMWPPQARIGFATEA